MILAVFEGVEQHLQEGEVEEGEVHTMGNP